MNKHLRGAAQDARYGRRAVRYNVRYGRRVRYTTVWQYYNTGIVPGEERGGDAHVVLQHLEDGHLQLVDAPQGAPPDLAEVAVPPGEKR